MPNDSKPQCTVTSAFSSIVSLKDAIKCDGGCPAWQCRSAVRGIPLAGKVMQNDARGDADLRDACDIDVAD